MFRESKVDDVFESLRMMRALTGCALVLALVLPGAEASAQRERDVDRARAHFESGLEAIEADNWEQARAEFQASYDLAPRPTTLMNLAAALVQVGRWVDASDAYRRFLGMSRDGPAAEHRAAAEEALARLMERMPKIRVRIVDAQLGDRVTLDGRPLLAVAMTRDVIVDPGEHELVLERADEEPIRMRFRAEEGVVREVVLARGQTPIAPEIAAVPEEDGEEIYESPWFWVIGGVLLAGAGVGVALGIVFTDAGTVQPFVGNVPPGRIGVD
jgi:hypothetical protein